jgi:hypothetical protein
MNDLINSTFQKNKKLYISLGVFLGSCGLGYIFWKAFKYFRMKQISHEQAEKFKKENKDLFKEGSDPTNKLDEGVDKEASTEIKQDEKENQKVEEIKPPQAEEKKEEFYDSKLMNELLKKITNIVVISIMKELKFLELNNEKLIDKIQFKSEGKNLNYNLFSYLCNRIFYLKHFDQRTNQLRPLSKISLLLFQFQ